MMFFYGIMPSGSPIHAISRAGDHRPPTDDRQPRFAVGCQRS